MTQIKLQGILQKFAEIIKDIVLYKLRYMRIKIYSAVTRMYSKILYIVILFQINMLCLHIHLNPFK